jgi:hypothetical protein
MVLNNIFEAPYNKFAPEGAVPIISKALVKARLSPKFYEITSNEFNENKGASPEIMMRNQNFEKSENKNQEILRARSAAKENENNSGNELENLKETIMKLKNEIKVINCIFKNF